MQKQTDKISVIVPAYNAEETLARCVESILSQSHKELEVIVVDDGSCDSTAQVADALSGADQRVRMIRQDNKGAMKARICGTKVAEGSWIAFVDADDRIDPDMYERLLGNAKRYKKMISHCGYQWIDTTGEIRPCGNTGRIEVQDRTAAIKAILSGTRSSSSLCNKLFSSGLFQKICGEPCLKVDLRHNEDLLLNYLLFSKADGAVYDGFCPYHYHKRSGSVSLSGIGRDHLFDMIRIRDLIRQSIDPSLYDMAQKKYLAHCLDTYNRLLFRKGDYTKELSEIRERILAEQESLTRIGGKIEVLGKLLLNRPKLYRSVVADLKKSLAVRTDHDT